jgi:hypothetical protein
MGSARIKFTTGISLCQYYLFGKFTQKHANGAAQFVLQNSLYSNPISYLRFTAALHSIPSEGK